MLRGGVGPGLALAVVLAVGLAGCISQGGPEAIVPAEAATLPAFRLLPGEAPEVVGAGMARLAGCEEQFGAFPLGMDMARDYAPEGFELLPFDPAGLMATMVAFGTRCAETSGPGLDPGPARLLSGGLLARAPAELAREDAGFHVLSFGILLDREDLVARWTGLGEVQVHLATATEWETVDAGGAGVRTGRVAMRSEDAGVALRTITEGGTVPAEGNLARWYAVRDRQVVGIYDWAWTTTDAYQGQAEVEYVDGAFPFPMPGAGVGFHYLPATHAMALAPVGLPQAAEPPAGASEPAPARGGAGAGARAGA